VEQAARQSAHAVVTSSSRNVIAVSPSQNSHNAAAVRKWLMMMTLMKGSLQHENKSCAYEHH